MRPILVKILLGGLTATLLFADAGPWKTVKIKDGIVVKTRPVEGSGFKEFQGVTQIKTSLASLIALLDDTSAYTLWMPNCTEARVVKKKSAFENYIYTVRRAPWPVKNRDMVIHTVTTRNKKDNSILIRMAGAPGLVPENADNVRVDKLSGFWLLTPRGENVEIVYQVHADLGGNVPEWLANSTSVEQPYKVLTNIRNLVASQKYQSVATDSLRKYEN